MNITLIGNFGRSWDNSICDEENLAVALEGLGHEVNRFQREETREAYWKQPRADFVLISQWDGYADDIVDRLRFFTKGPVVYWAFDHQWNPPADWHLKLIERCDVFLTKEIDHIKDYQNICKTDVYWLPQDFAPDFLQAPEGDSEKSIDVLFTGTYLPGAEVRTEVLKVVAQKFDLCIYSVTADAWRSQGFHKVFDAVVDENMARLVTKAKINLSVEIYEAPGYWSDRNAQVMVCGGFVLYKHEPFAETTFRDNIAYFYNVEDCLKKIEYYLKNSAEREQIARKGKEFANNNLRATHRAKDMLTVVGRYL